MYVGFFSATAGPNHSQSRKTSGSLVRIPEISVEVTSDIPDVTAGMFSNVSLLHNSMFLKDRNAHFMFVVVG